MTPTLEVVTTDYHTAGEPFRIVIDGAPDIGGITVADRRLTAIESPDVQRIRRLLCQEPRGHADMYGCFLVPPDDGGAQLGVLFWHKDGFSTACGHGTIALAVWAVESDRVPADPDGPTAITIDVPSGRVVATVHRVGGRITRVVFRNVPSFVLHRSVPLDTSRGSVTVDVSFGGAIYASVPASELGLSVVPAAVDELTSIGREIKWLTEKSGLAVHPSDDRLSGCYGTIIYDDLPDGENGPAQRSIGQRGVHQRGVHQRGVHQRGVHQRNVTVFADGEIDRSPCGSGTSARMALLAADGRLAPGQTFIHDSVIGTRFTATVTGTAEVAGIPAVITEVAGRAHRTGEHRFVLEPADELGVGFLLR